MHWLLSLNSKTYWAKRRWNINKLNYDIDNRPITNIKTIIIRIMIIMTISIAPLYENMHEHWNIGDSNRFTVSEDRLTSNILSLGIHHRVNESTTSSFWRELCACYNYDLSSILCENVVTTSIRHDSSIRQRMNMFICFQYRCNTKVVPPKITPKTGVLPGMNYVYNTLLVDHKKVICLE